MYPKANAHHPYFNKESSAEQLHFTLVTVLQVFFFDFATKQEPAKMCSYFGLQNLVRPN